MKIEAIKISASLTSRTRPTRNILIGFNVKNHKKLAYYYNILKWYKSLFKWDPFKILTRYQKTALVLQTM